MESLQNNKDAKIRLAVEAMMAEADEVAKGNGEYATYDDVFNAEDDEQLIQERSKNMDKIDPNEVRKALVWLQYNGHEKDVDNILYKIKVLVQIAINENYAPESDEWDRRLRYAIKQINKLDRIYYCATGSHFIYKCKRDNKENMAKYISEFASAVLWQAFSDESSPDEENPNESE